MDAMNSKGCPSFGKEVARDVSEEKNADGELYAPDEVSGSHGVNKPVAGSREVRRPWTERLLRTLEGASPKGGRVLSMKKNRLPGSMDLNARVETAPMVELYQYRSKCRT